MRNKKNYPSAPALNCSKYYCLDKFSGMILTHLLQKMLEKNRHHLIELEIRPIFLVPDTNCFIDHLPSLQKLIGDRQFTIVIPLVGKPCQFYCLWIICLDFLILDLEN